MAAAMLRKIRLALSALVLIVIALWFWGRGIWPHELEARRTGELLWQVSIKVFAIAGLLRLANALLGENYWGTELQFISRRYGQAFFPEELPRGLKACIALTVVGAVAGFAVTWLSKATYVPRGTLPMSGSTFVSWVGNLAFDVYSLVLAWLFATAAPHLTLSLARIGVNVISELSDHVLGDRFPAIRILRAGRTLSAATSHEQKLGAVAVLTAIPGPIAEKTLREALERPDDSRLHAAIVTTLRNRGWSPATPLQWRRVALSAPTRDPGCMQALVDLLRDPDPKIHQHAARVLDSFGWSPSTSEELVAFLLARSQGKPDYVSIAREGEAAITSLLQIVDNRFPGRPAEAWRALLGIPSERVTRILLERVAADKTDKVYQSIVEAYCDTKFPHAPQVLMALFESNPATRPLPDLLEAVLAGRPRASLAFLSPHLTAAFVKAARPGQSLRWGMLLSTVDRQAWHAVAHNNTGIQVLTTLVQKGAAKGVVESHVFDAMWNGTPHSRALFTNQLAHAFASAKSGTAAKQLASFLLKNAPEVLKTACRTPPGAEMLRTLFQADLANRRVDPELACMLAGQSPAMCDFVAMALSRALGECKDPTFSRTIASAFKSVDRRVAGTLLETARRQKAAWCGPSAQDLNEAKKAVAALANAQRAGDWKEAESTLRYFLRDYCPYLPVSDLKTLSQLDVMLSGTFLEYESYRDDGCGNAIPEGDLVKRAATVDCAHIKQVARQELLRRSK